MKMKQHMRIINTDVCIFVLQVSNKSSHRLAQLSSQVALELQTYRILQMHT